MFFRVAPYMRKWCSVPDGTADNLAVRNGALWTPCGRGPFSGERDTPADVRGIGAVLEPRMEMALRSGPARLAIRCRRRSRRRRRRDRNRASASDRRAALLRTAARLLSPTGLFHTGLLPTRGLLLWAATAPVSH
jgi:hypothetical protein